MNPLLIENLQAALGPGFTVTRELGGGGMSRVFLVVDQELRREVVVKLLAPELLAELSAERFAREIKLAARLQHPHIVPLITTGSAAGIPYYTMPFVDGETLRDRLTRSGEFSVSDATRILREIASALAYAHGKGVVHRDIKPENILLTGDIALVTDFGVAKALIDATTVGARPLTAAGVTVGTPMYMSPEQVSADPAIDHRADLYAFGVVAYEMLCGQPPFTARTTQALLAAHVIETPQSIDVRRASVRPELAALVMRCLQKRPADRPQDANEIVRTIDNLRDASTSMGAAPTIGQPAINPASAPRTNKWIAIAAVAAMLVALIIDVVRSRSTTPGTIAEVNGIPVVAVLPFDVRGDTTRAFLGEALSALLSGRLDAPEVLRTLESNAVLRAIGKRSIDQNIDVDAAQARVSRLGANLFVTGTVVVLGDRLEINAELRSPLASSHVVRAHVEGPADSLFILADQLGAELLVKREGRALGNAALGGTSSVPALKSLLAGERALRDWQLFDAIAAYNAALAIDSTYALAWYRLGFAKGWAGLDGENDARAHALRFVSRLPERNAMLIAAVDARAHNDVRAERDLLTLVQRYPDDADAWAELGEYRVHVSPLLGQPTTNAEAPLARTLQLDSLGHPEVRLHLSQLAFEAGDIAAARKLIAPLLTRGIRNDRVIHGLQLALALALGPAADPAIPDAATLVRALREESAQALGRSLQASAGSVGITKTAYALAESLTTSASSPQHQAAALAVLMQFDAARNNWEEAKQRGASLAAIDSVAAAEMWWTLAGIPAVVMSKEIWNRAGDILERSASSDTSNAGMNHIKQAALLAVRAANEASFTRRLNRIATRKHLSTEDSTILHGLRAIHAQSIGDSATETHELQNLTGPINAQWLRWARAAWLERIGKTEDAERWYLSTPWGPWVVLFRGRAFEQAARLELARGNRSEAARFSERARRFTSGSSN